MIQISVQTIEEVPAAKYLGVWLDKKRKFSKHIKEITQKAEKTVATLTRLMGNVNGPGTMKRRMLGQVHASILLYLCP